MKTWERSSKVLTIAVAVVMLAGCAATGPYNSPNSSVQAPPPAPAPAPAPTYLNVGAQDRLYVLHVENQTPFRVSLPNATNVLYEKGYDRVQRQREADFALDISLNTEARDNPNLRGEQMLGGAILGAATGALLGAAAGAPVTGTIAGAAGGGVLGLAAPANTPMIRIGVRTESYRDGTTSEKSVVVDMANVPPYDVPRVIDAQISKMIDELPAR